VRVRAYGIFHTDRPSLDLLESRIGTELMVGSGGYYLFFFIIRELGAMYNVFFVLTAALCRFYPTFRLECRVLWSPILAIER